MSYFNQFTNKFLRLIDRLDMQEVGVIVACVLVVGFICMRGLGSHRKC